MKSFLLFIIGTLFTSLATHSQSPVSSHLGSLDSISSLPTELVAEKGERLFNEGEYDRALPFFTVVCRRYDGDADKKTQALFATAYERYGNILYRKGAYALAMDAYLQARKIAEKHSLGGNMASSYARIGNIYASCGDYEGAISFYQKALSREDVKKNHDLYSMILNNLFATNLLGGNVSEAKRYLESYKNELTRNRGNFRHEFDVLLAEGMLNDAADEPLKAMEYFRKALHCAKTYNLPPLCEGSAYSSLASPYEKTGHPDSAIICLKAACDIADSIGNGRLVVESLREIARVFEARNMRDSAMEYRSKYLSMADTIAYQEEVNKLKSSQMLYELDQSAFTIKSLNDERDTQRKVTAVVTVAAVLCGLMLIVLVRQNKKLRNAWTALYERNSRHLLDEIKYTKTIQEYQKAIREINEPSVPEIPASAEPEVADGISGKDETTRKAILDTATRERIASDINLFMENTDEYCSPEFNLDRLASAIGSNPRYVSEVVNVVFQKNFRAWLNEYRIKQAMLRLEDTEHYGNYTIKAISESVGYKSQATFISVFTKLTGLKPRIYQKLTFERRQ